MSAGELPQFANVLPFGDLLQAIRPKMNGFAMLSNDLYTYLRKPVEENPVLRPRFKEGR